MTNCGLETCRGKACGNFGDHVCKGVDWTLPPWSVVARLERLGETIRKLQEEWRKAK